MNMCCQNYYVDKNSEMAPPEEEKAARHLFEGEMQVS